jgi:hypothetical protein
MKRGLKIVLFALAVIGLLFVVLVAGGTPLKQ